MRTSCFLLFSTNTPTTLTYLAQTQPNVRRRKHSASSWERGLCIRCGQPYDFGYDPNFVKPVCECESFASYIIEGKNDTCCSYHTFPVVEASRLYRYSNISHVLNSATRMVCCHPGQLFAVTIVNQKTSHVTLEIQRRLMVAIGSFVSTTL